MKLKSLAMRSSSQQGTHTHAKFPTHDDFLIKDIGLHYNLCIYEYDDVFETCTFLAETYCCHVLHVSAPLSPEGGGEGRTRVRAGGINSCMGGGGAPEVDATVKGCIDKER